MVMSRAVVVMSWLTETWRCGRVLAEASASSVVEGDGDLCCR